MNCSSICSIDGKKKNQAQGSKVLTFVQQLLSARDLVFDLLKSYKDPVRTFFQKKIFKGEVTEAHKNEEICLNTLT